MAEKIQRCGSEMAWGNCRFRGAEENKTEDGCECKAPREKYFDCEYHAIFKPQIINLVWPEKV